MKKIAVAIAMLVGTLLQAQSPYSVNIFPAKVITATSTTTTAINLGTVATVPKSGSYSSGVIQLTGTALTTATFGVTASSDNGVTYFAVPICTVAATPSCASTQTATAAAIYTINLGGLTHIKYVTSGTFTATNISLLLTAAPNSQISKSSAGGTPAPCTDGNNYDCLDTAQTITAAKIISTAATGTGLTETSSAAAGTNFVLNNTAGTADQMHIQVGNQANFGNPNQMSIVDDKANAAAGAGIVSFSMLSGSNPILVTSTGFIFCLGNSATDSRLSGGCNTTFALDTFDNGGFSFNKAVRAVNYRTATNCSSAASPAVCGAAAAGSFVIATAATTVTVNTTAVTANSQITITPDESLGTKLGVTCNSTAAVALATYGVSARVAGTSFTVTTTGTVATNPACYGYSIIN